MRFKNKTKGGYEYRIYAEYEGQEIDRYHGAIKRQNDWKMAEWDNKGIFSGYHNKDFDLISDIPAPIDEICTFDVHCDSFRLKNTGKALGWNHYKPFEGHTVRLRIEVVE